jgi:hypothetical protein
VASALAHFSGEAFSVLPHRMPLRVIRDCEGGEPAEVFAARLLKDEEQRRRLMPNNEEQ